MLDPVGMNTFPGVRAPTKFTLHKVGTLLVVKVLEANKFEPTYSATVVLLKVAVNLTFAPVAYAVPVIVSVVLVVVSSP